MSGKPRILDHVQREKILQLREQGISPDMIAVRFGVKRSLIDKTLHRMRRAQRQAR